MSTTILTDEKIEQGREAIFSTSNPFCPCDSKTMRKAARWAEQAVLQSPEVQAWKRDAGLCAEYRKLLEGAAAVLANSAEELEEGVPNECLAHEARSMAQTILFALLNDAAMEKQP